MHVLPSIISVVLHAQDLHREKKKRKELAIYATFDYIKKNGYTVASDGENLHVLEFFAVGNKGKAVLFFSFKGSVHRQTFACNSFFDM